MKNIQDLMSVFEENKKSLRDYIFSMLKDSHASDDIIQEVFVRLQKQDPEKIKDHIVPWLFTVSRNQSIKYSNKRRRYVELNEELDSRVCDELDPSEKIVYNDLLDQVKETLYCLNDRESKMVHYRYYDELSYEDISKKMNLSVTNVGFILHTAIKKLKKEFNKMERKTLSKIEKLNIFGEQD